MSLKRFIKNVAKAISNLFKGLTKVAKKAVDLAVKVVNEIKNFDAENPQAINFITALIPGDVDDKIVAAVRAKLPKIMISLKLVDETLKLSDTEIIIAGIKELQKLKGIQRNITLNSLAILIADVAADGRITWDELSMLVKWYYDNVANKDVDTTI